MNGDIKINTEYFQTIIKIWQEINQVPLNDAVFYYEKFNYCHPPAASNGKYVKWQYIMYFSSNRRKHEMQEDLIKLKKQIPVVLKSMEEIKREKKTRECLAQKISHYMEEAEELKCFVKHLEDKLNTIECLITVHHAKMPANRFINWLFRTPQFITWKSIKEQYISQLRLRTEQYIDLCYAAEDKAAEFNRYNSHLNNIDENIADLSKIIIDFKLEKQRLQLKYSI